MPRPAPTTPPGARRRLRDAAGNAAAPAATAGKRIDINSASENEIATLPGVGPATAKNIVQGRPWDDLNDLVKKKAMAQAVLRPQQGPLRARQHQHLLGRRPGQDAARDRRQDRAQDRQRPPVRDAAGPGEQEGPDRSAVAEDQGRDHLLIASPATAVMARFMRAIHAWAANRRRGWPGRAGP